MFKIIRNIVPFLPDKYKNEFANTVIRENFLKLIICAVFIIFLESAIFIFFKDRLFNIEKIIISIIILNLIFLPVFFYLKKIPQESCHTAKKTIQTIYVLAMLVWGCAMSVVPQSRFGFINVYVMVLFAASAFILIKPVTYLFIFSSVYVGFFFILPYYQLDSNAVVILRINAFGMNIFAWIFSRMVIKMRMHSFLDKKTIEEKNLRLRDMAVRDSMTNLLNHDHSFKMLHDEIQEAADSGSALSLIMADIDHFKQINDRFGHTTGDEIIIGFSQILLKTCRISDILGRYGGEEFIIILPNTLLKDAAAIAERIRATVESFDFRIGAPMTVSGGICEYKGESAEEFINKTDEKLYRAKAEGRNRFII
ncbi:MAG: GGDEF domain-containing protein [Spirochaetes bacterium]|nr:GGDEF domain-containing protein [Spirochaetota bacterium]